MTEHDLRDLANRLRSDSPEAVDEAAFFLELLAPIANAISPIVGHLIRAKVQRRREEGPERMARELAGALAELHDGPERLAAKLRAERMLDNYRQWIGAAS